MRDTAGSVGVEIVVLDVGVSDTVGSVGVEVVELDVGESDIKFSHQVENSKCAK